MGVQFSSFCSVTRLTIDRDYRPRKSLNKVVDVINFL
jgi:hypothetical protein